MRPLLFLVQEARGPELGTTGRPAPRAEMALLFLVQEARRVAEAEEEDAEDARLKSNNPKQMVGEKFSENLRKKFRNIFDKVFEKNKKMKNFRKKWKKSKNNKKNGKIKTKHGKT